MPRGPHGKGTEGAERTVRGKGDKHMDMLWKSESGAPEERGAGMQMWGSP